MVSTIIWKNIFFIIFVYPQQIIWSTPFRWPWFLFSIQNQLFTPKRKFIYLFLIFLWEKKIRNSFHANFQWLKWSFNRLVSKLSSSLSSKTLNIVFTFITTRSIFVCKFTFKHWIRSYCYLYIIRLSDPENFIMICDSKPLLHRCIKIR